MQIYVQHGGRQLGPFTEEELKAQLTSGSIAAQDYVWWQGQANWILLSQSQFAPAPVPGMPPPPAIPTSPPPPVVNNSGLPRWVMICGCGLTSFVGLALILAFISVVAISVLIALGNQVKGVFSTINSQIAADSTNSDSSSTDQNSSTSSSSDQSTSTNSDQSTNAPAATSPDQSTNSDQSTNAAPTTPSSGSSTNSSDSSSSSTKSPATSH